jgi:hypothetical protein
MALHNKRMSSNRLYWRTVHHYFKWIVGTPYPWNKSTEVGATNILYAQIDMFMVNNLNIHTSMKLLLQFV